MYLFLGTFVAVGNKNGCNMLYGAGEDKHICILPI